MQDLQQHRGYRLLIVVALSLSLAVFIKLGTTLVVRPSFVALDDYVEYWSAGRLNLSGKNPYDRDRLTALQLTTGRITDVPVMMWNPPWTLVLIMPLSWLDYPLSRVLWLLLHLGVVLFCTDWLWCAYGGTTENRWVAWGIAFTYAPLLHVLKYGQIAPLLLLGLTGFLYFIEKRRWWLAGGAATLITIKPHILYLFAVALLLWVVHQRRWAVAWGFTVMILSMLSVAWAVNPNLLAQYTYALANYPPVDWATPTLGGMLRLLLGIDKFWLQFLPSLLGFVWLSTYWWHRRDHWDWRAQVPLIITVSVATAAYGWTYDYTVLLPAIIQAALLLLGRRSLFDRGLILAYLAVTLFVMFSTGHQIQYWWLAPSLLIWYLLAVQLSRRQLRVSRLA